MATRHHETIESCTQASFSTMQYKGWDYASGTVGDGQKLSIIRPGTITFVAPESVGTMTSGPKHTIQHSIMILTYLILKRIIEKRAVSSDPT